MKTDMKRLLQDCFWDLNLDEDDLKQIIKEGNKRELKKLFSRIIYNSQDKLRDLQIFTKDQIREFLADFKVTYNHKYVNRHILIIKSLILGEKHQIKGLEWKKR